LTLLLTPLLPQVLVPGVFGSEVEDRGQPIDLHPGEAAIVAAAGEKRRRDFALGRFCAHTALTQLGQPQDMVGSGRDGAPLWPQGLCGSITHTMGYAASLVAGRECFAGLGLDAEHVGGVTEKLWPRLFNESERAMLIERGDRAIAATILFSAKEACFKAQGSASGPFASIHIELSETGFLAQSKAGELRGLFTVRESLVLTAAYWPAR
jgi:4'-phosphopantetheinyl transferase EntD